MHILETINSMMVQYYGFTEIRAYAYADLNAQTKPKTYLQTIMNNYNKKTRPRYKITFGT